MEQASLAFFQSFYTNVSLYVVPDSAASPAAPAGPAPTAAAPETAVAPAAPAPVARPASVPVAAAPVPPAQPAVAPTPPTPAPVVAAPAPAATPSKLPSMAALNLQPTPARPVVAPATPPVVPPTAPTPVAAPIVPAATAPDGPPPRTAPPLSATPYSTLGSNANGLVILVRMDPVRFQRLPKNVFLNNLLKAIRLVMEDVVLINVESHLPVELKTIRQKLAARQIIGFGKNLLDVAIRTTHLYEPVLLVGDAAYLPAAEIELLEEDNSRKKLLWQAMQRMFLS